MKGVHILMDQTLWLNFKLEEEIVDGEGSGSDRDETSRGERINFQKSHRE